MSFSGGLVKLGGGRPGSPWEGPARVAACPPVADAAARAGGTCGPTGASGPATRSRFRLVFRGLPFTHGLAAELEAVGVVDEAVENGVGESWIADHLVPLVERKLAGDEDGGRQPPSRRRCG